MFKNSSVFRRYLVSYLIILIIPSIAGYMSYLTSISVMTKVSIDNSVTQLKQSQELLERRMSEVEGFTRQLAIHPDLGILMNETVTEGRPNVFGILKMLRHINTFGQTNDFLQNFFIYLSNYDVILTPGSAYFRPEHYFENYRYTDISFEEWKKDVLGRAHRSELMPLQPFKIGSSNTSVITYLQSLPLDSFSETSPAVIGVLIDKKAIARHLSAVTERYGGWVHVSDKEGRMISLQGTINQEDVEAMVADSRFDGSQVSQFYEDNLVITIKSGKNGWVYRAGIPKQVLLENANQIKFITWTVTGIALLIGLLVGLLLSYRNSKPIHWMLSIFGQDTKTDRKANAYDFLQGNIAEMLTSNRRLESELRQQQPLVRDAFYKRLVAGEFRTRDEVVAAAIQANAGLSGNVGYVAIIQINGYIGMDSVEVLKELHAARLVLRKTLSELAGFLPLTDMGSDRLVVLFAFEEGGAREYSEGEVDKLLHRLTELMFQDFKISIVSAVGERFQLVTDISHSFGQAKQTLDYVAELDNKAVVWFRETQETDAYYYPIDAEQRLIGTIRAGEAEEARRIVEQIVSQNTVHRKLSLEMRGQLALEMKGTLLKLLDQKPLVELEAADPIKNRIIAMQTADSIESFQTEFNEIIEATCEIIARKRNDMHLRTIEQIKQFIAIHYGDTELTLYRIAEQVERPEKYISQLFKEVTGINLSDYLERVRMERSEELLQDSSRTIDEIAGLVGYNSSHSFRRAFKRVMGVPPSTYRNTAGTDQS
ncbi:AraC family transcriptional regulator [Paenibacillaceae bacterium]|nr:AraC family transcriptional regulator [Paenibacillaceae bacterium]